ncbi:hypothetical protein [Mucilaginibacter polytrichastri]|uniref:Uncharacterized protein n=1 Tax=Mucilaginibacter polytrichastri TaxID=1302689 RepID=A0A1Q5ZV40_9SPHI|nr:hypothetical protein [Mucilaginibacter polytrichastri]OKS85637.1 hypothetical protein RG47T_1083 [Mucilaginibacter polytrichastri]
MLKQVQHDWRKNNCTCVYNAHVLIFFLMKSSSGLTLNWGKPGIMLKKNTPTTNTMG